MIFSKKNNELIRQNEKIVKKPKKHDTNLQKNSTIYFQVGLIICLLLAYGALEMEFEISNHDYAIIHVEDEPEFYYALSLVVEEKPQVKKIEIIIIKRKQIINPKFIPSNVETVNSIEFTIEPTTSEQAKIKDIVLHPKPKGH